MPRADPAHADPVPFATRQRDRRRGLGEVIAAVVRGVTGRLEGGLLRGAFEEAVSHIAPVRSVVLRETTSRWIGVRSERGGGESAAFEVPGTTPAGRAILEAHFDAGCRLGEWDFHLLGQAAQLGAVVLELERLRARSRPTAPSSAARPVRDGAAPLIGSTPAMSALRTKIERVAHTDFTVLLEGDTGA